MTVSLGEVQTVEGVRELDTSMQKQLAIEALSNLGTRDGADAVRQAGLAPPGQGTSNIVWIMIVAAFCIALGQVVQGFDPELMLTVFTASAGFLAGLLSPSPIGGR